MGGIVFFRTKDLEKTVTFYKEKIGMQTWLDQGGCHILSFGNMLVGFCQSEEKDNNGIITFFYNEKEKVDKKYEELKEISTSPPVYNEKYRIYQFFGKDHEGRTLEFQYFCHEIPKI